MTSRSQLSTEISDFAQRYPQDRPRCQRFLDFIRAHPDCAHRSLEVGHLTGAAWLIDPVGDQVLLTHHRKLDRWLQLGGHADGDLDLAAVALKEAEEESGLDQLLLLQPLFDLDDHRIPARKSDPEHTHYDFRYVIVAHGSLEPKISHESLDLRWWPVQALTGQQWDESLNRMARRWLANRERWLSDPPR